MLSQPLCGLPWLTPQLPLVIPDTTKTRLITKDISALIETEPTAFWTALREEKPISPSAPSAAS
ncbi:hypothetical protein [Arthrobacter sp. H20]|uniref:hypothetical protein n=1 Tax=Arthrobacter sp. H20 TaxID=1267981 RepID=UPI0012DF5CDE|nr:hypothetical protein [Arthrobacter sp. H20]